MGHLILLSSKIKMDGKHEFFDLMVRRFLSFRQLFPLQVCFKGTFINDVPRFLAISDLPTYLALLYNVPFLGLSWNPLPILIRTSLINVPLLMNKFWLFREHTFPFFLFQSFFFDRPSKGRGQKRLLFAISHETQCHLIMEN